MNNTFLMMVKASADQVAAILKAGVEVVNIEQHAQQAVTVTPHHAVQRTRVVATAKKTTKKFAKTKTNDMRGRRNANSNVPTMAQRVLEYFQDNPTQVYHTDAIGAVVKRYGFKSNGYSAIHNMFMSIKNAPVRKVGTSMYQFDPTLLAGHAEGAVTN